VLDCALKLEVRFYLPRPKRTKNTRPSVRPDLDNYVKALKDALNGIVWSDDSRICDLWAEKHYAAEGTRPRIEMRVEEIIPQGEADGSERDNGVR
jgi:Holliday junction resolvase RusA-like endonuclease